MTFGKDCAHYCAFYDNYVYKLWRRLFDWINTHCFRKLLGFPIKWYHHLERHVCFEFETKSTRKIIACVASVSNRVIARKLQRKKKKG